MDSKSNLNNKHWTNIIFTTPTPVFISATPTKQIQQNVINIANEIEKAILSIDIIKVLAIITDNILAKTILEKAKKIVIFFRNHIILATILKKYQKEKYGSNYKLLKLPVKTHWYSAAKYLDSVYKNQLALYLTITEIFSINTIEIDNEIKTYIYEENF
ncbi:5294_t:CDS:2 [Scutellospora calospora]|uniref:5294_t:CDS:1 n=1 Tax=Scutellospora calospora TaxID=85575 RepID=A0ACA9LUD2_9GLOM|nr:5294_t:CDS:2 [Scutellospora calospora]